MKYRVTYVVGSLLLQDHLNQMASTGYRIFEIYKNIDAEQFTIIWELIA